MFRTVPLSIIRSLLTVHLAMVYVIQVCRQLSIRTTIEAVWHTPLLSVQLINSWWWTEEQSETCRVSWQNKFVKLVYLVGLIIKKCVTMNGHMNVKFVSANCISTWVCKPRPARLYMRPEVTFVNCVQTSCICSMFRAPTTYLFLSKQQQMQSSVWM